MIQRYIRVSGPDGDRYYGHCDEHPAASQLLRDNGWERNKTSGDFYPEGQPRSALSAKIVLLDLQPLDALPRVK